MRWIQVTTHQRSKIEQYFCPVRQLLSSAHNLDAATKPLVESVTPQRSHRKDTRGSLFPTSGKLPILGFRLPYVGHLDPSLSPSLKRQGASCCQVDYCEVEYLHHEDCSAAVLSKAMDHGYILAELCHAVVSHNAQEQVTCLTPCHSSRHAGWLHASRLKMREVVKNRV